MSYHRRALGSTQSRPSLYTRVSRGMDGYGVDVRVGGPLGRARVQTSLGSTQSRPSNFTRVSRGGDGMGASAAEYNLVSSALDFVGHVLGLKTATATRSAPAPARVRQRMPVPAMRGFGSLGDSTDLEPATSLSQTSVSSPTLVDPQTAAWQASMLQQTQIIAAAQQDFTAREVKARYLQIAATLAIPVAAAAWRAVGRVLAGRREERDFE